MTCLLLACHYFIIEFIISICSSFCALLLRIIIQLSLSFHVSVCTLNTFPELDLISTKIKNLDKILDEIRHFRRTKNDVLDNIFVLFLVLFY